MKWYLMNSSTKPNSIGGYEGESFADFKGDSFSEILNDEEGISTSVSIYNYDLSIKTDIRCIIQGNVSDTQDSAMRRSILCPIGSLHAGDYVYYDKCYWLVYSYPSNNSVYEKAIITLCQHKIKWQGRYGDIVERWGSFATASKYDVGEDGAWIVHFDTNNFIFLLPSDDETMYLNERRIFVDRRTPPESVYKFTRNDDPIYNYLEHGSVLSFILSKDEFNANTDNQSVGLCDYVNIEKYDNDGDINIVINGSNTIKVGYYGYYDIAIISDSDNEDAVLTATSDIGEDLVITRISNGEIKLFVDGDENIGEKITLSANIGNKCYCKKDITITGLF